MVEKRRRASISNYSVFERGMRLQAEYEGVYYAAEVVTVSTAPRRSKAPVKVHFLGYPESDDLWLSGNQLRSKAAVKTGKDKGLSNQSAEGGLSGLTSMKTAFREVSNGSAEAGLPSLSLMKNAYSEGKKTQLCSTGRCACFQYKHRMPWKSWRSKHPDESKRGRQFTEWIEFTHEDNHENITGLTQGVLRLQPYGSLPVHYHPEPYAETYYFIRGNGHVRLSKGLMTDPPQSEEELEMVPIEPGLHVEIPAATIHGMDAGSEGAEFIWTFACSKWTDIPYIYIDPHLSPRNVKPQARS